MTSKKDRKDRKESERRDEIKVKQAKFICDKRLSHRFLGLKRVANCSLGELFLNPLHGSSDVGDFPIAQTVKNLPATQEPQINPWVKKIPWRRKETATHSGTLAWRIPGTEEPGGLQSMGSQRVGHD